jgi:hypothetical protein
MGGGMWLQFFEQNIHFALYMFVALVFFAVSWLYFDAWSNKRAPKELLKWSGFAGVGVSFIVQALIVNQDLLSGPYDTAASALRLIGFLAIVAAQLIDPLQPIPKLTGLYGPEEAEKPKKSAAWYTPISLGAKWLLPVVGGYIAWLYYHRATKGLERHYKKVAYAFAAFAVSDALALLTNLHDTSNPTLYSWVRIFGPIWLVQQIVLLAGAIMLGNWVWGYLTKRFFSQLLMIFILAIGTVFLIVSVGFTSLLLRDIHRNAQANLEVSTQVLSYAFEAKQSEAAGAAEQVAGSAQIIAAVANKDHQALVALTKNYLVSKKQSDLMITDDAGQVLLRAIDTDRWGDSVSSDPLVKRALLGIDKSGVIVEHGITIPVLQVRSVAAVRATDGTLLGTVTTSLNLDTAFVGGIKRATGLDSSLYAGDVLAATTRTSTDGKNSAVGAVLTNKAIVDQVLHKNKVYSGSLAFANQQLVGAFVPILDPDGVPVAILSVDKTESSLLETAGRSVQLTRILTAALLIVSIVPVYFVTRNLVRQVE